jgi:hypothetical protein
MKIKFLHIVILLFICNAAFPQLLLNKKQVKVAAGYMIIKGAYQNEDTGNITLNGTIQLTGNWTNNAANTVMSVTDGIGTVVFNGSSLQTIGGTSTSFFNFEGITISAGASVQVQAGTGITAAGPCTFTTPLLLKSTYTAFRPKMATFINNGTVTGKISSEFSYSSTGSAAAGTGHGQFFSPPISNATSALFDVASGINHLWSQNPVTRKYVKILTNVTALTPLQGYILRSAVTNVFTFTGPPNAAASYSKSGIPRDTLTPGWYLAGNPYPAVVNWHTISKTNLRPTIWYRCATTSGSMTVDTWNDSAMIGTSNNGTLIDAKISPLQGFWVQVSAVGLTGTLGIANTDRGHDWGNAAFLKSAIFSDRDVFRIAIYSSIFKDENIIVQSDSASDGLDGWDSQKLFLSDILKPEIFTIAPEGTKLVIQSVKPITIDKLFPLGMIIGTAGNFLFNVDLTQSNTQYDYYLEDKLLGNIQDLRMKPTYLFASDVVNDSLGARFVLLFHNTQALTSITPIEPGIKEPYIYSYGKNIYIENCEVHAEIIIYNLLGSQIYNSFTNSDKERISISSASGVYLVRLANRNGWKIQKLLLKDSNE